jgi:predicted amidohydrolase YtcJ
VTAGPATPYILLFNGTIAAPASPAPVPQAVAITQGRISAVGRDQEILPLAGPGSEKIDLEGRLVTPGFIDSHIHFYEWALQRQGLTLHDLTGLEHLLEQVHKAAHHRPRGQWIMGQGWNETDWTEPVMPSRKALDQAAPHHPVLLWRCDLHLAVVNSAALELAGIDEQTTDPPDGMIERDAAGRPTGVLREMAINLVRETVAPPSTEAVTDAFKEAAGALHRRGVTGIHDIRLMDDKDGARAFQAFQALDLNDELALRCWVSLPGHRLDEVIALGMTTGFGNSKLRVGHVKFFSDGGMGARTAWMIDPYLDAERGMPLMDMAFLAQEIYKADAAGLSVMVHAVGDRANREMIHIFETLADRRSKTKSAPPPSPHRIEHAQMIRPEDAVRLGPLNLALCVTPANMVLDMNLIDRVVGDKGKWTYAFRRLLDTGVPVVFSSDCPVCDPDPLLGIHAAVTRQRRDGTPREGWHPGNRVTVAEALRAYTAAPAAIHNAPEVGVIAPGKKADLAVLSDNMLTGSPARIPDVRVDMTLVDGRIVHRRF